jgi:hypothetical protein
MKCPRSVIRANWLKITDVIKVSHHQDMMMETEVVSESIGDF